MHLLIAIVLPLMAFLPMAAGQPQVIHDCRSRVFDSDDLTTGGGIIVQDCTSGQGVLLLANFLSSMPSGGFFGINNISLVRAVWISTSWENSVSDPGQVNLTASTIFRFLISPNSSHAGRIRISNVNFFLSSMELASDNEIVFDDGNVVVVPAAPGSVTPAVFFFNVDLVNVTFTIVRSTIGGAAGKSLELRHTTLRSSTFEVINGDTVSTSFSGAITTVHDVLLDENSHLRITNISKIICKTLFALEGVQIHHGSSIHARGIVDLQLPPMGSDLALVHVHEDHVTDIDGDSWIRIEEIAFSELSGTAGTLISISGAVASRSVLRNITLSRISGTWSFQLASLVAFRDSDVENAVIEREIFILNLSLTAASPTGLFSIVASLPTMLRNSAIHVENLFLDCHDVSTASAFFTTGATLVSGVSFTIINSTLLMPQATQSTVILLETGTTVENSSFLIQESCEFRFGSSPSNAVVLANASTVLNSTIRITDFRIGGREADWPLIGCPVIIRNGTMANSTITLEDISDLHVGSAGMWIVDQHLSRTTIIVARVSITVIKAAARGEGPVPIIRSVLDSATTLTITDSNLNATTNPVHCGGSIMLNHCQIKGGSSITIENSFLVLAPLDVAAGYAFLEGGEISVSAGLLLGCGTGVEGVHLEASTVRVMNTQVITSDGVATMQAAILFNRGRIIDSHIELVDIRGDLVANAPQFIFLERLEFDHSALHVHNVTAITSTWRNYPLSTALFLSIDHVAISHGSSLVFQDVASESSSFATDSPTSAQVPFVGQVGMHSTNISGASLIAFNASRNAEWGLPSWASTSTARRITAVTFALAEMDISEDSTISIHNLNTSALGPDHVAMLAVMDSKTSGGAKLELGGVVSRVNSTESSVLVVGFERSVLGLTTFSVEDCSFVAIGSFTGIGISLRNHSKIFSLQVRVTGTNFSVVGREQHASAFQIYDHTHVTGGAIVFEDTLVHIASRTRQAAAIMLVDESSVTAVSLTATRLHSHCEPTDHTDTVSQHLCATLLAGAGFNLTSSNVTFANCVFNASSNSAFGLLMERALLLSTEVTFDSGSISVTGNQPTLQAVAVAVRNSAWILGRLHIRATVFNVAAATVGYVIAFAISSVGMAMEIEDCAAMVSFTQCLGGQVPCLGHIGFAHAISTDTPNQMPSVSFLLRNVSLVGTAALPRLGMISFVFVNASDMGRMRMTIHGCRTSIDFSSSGDAVVLQFNHTSLMTVENPWQLVDGEFNVSSRAGKAAVVSVQNSVASSTASIDLLETRSLVRGLDAATFAVVDKMRSDGGESARIHILVLGGTLDLASESATGRASLFSIAGVASEDINITVAGEATIQIGSPSTFSAVAIYIREGIFGLVTATISDLRLKLISQGPSSVVDATALMTTLSASNSNFSLTSESGHSSFVRVTGFAVVILAQDARNSFEVNAHRRFSTTDTSSYTHFFLDRATASIPLVFLSSFAEGVENTEHSTLRAQAAEVEFYRQTGAAPDVTLPSGSPVQIPHYRYIELNGSSCAAFVNISELSVGNLTLQSQSRPSISHTPWLVMTAQQKVRLFSLRHLRAQNISIEIGATGDIWIQAPPDPGEHWSATATDSHRLTIMTVDIRIRSSVRVLPPSASRGRIAVAALSSVAAAAEGAAHVIITVANFTVLLPAAVPINVSVLDVGMNDAMEHVNLSAYVGAIKVEAAGPPVTTLLLLLSLRHGSHLRHCQVHVSAGVGRMFVAGISVLRFLDMGPSGNLTSVNMSGSGIDLMNVDGTSPAVQLLRMSGGGALVRDSELSLSDLRTSGTFAQELPPELVREGSLLHLEDTSVVSNTEISLGDASRIPVVGPLIAASERALQYTTIAISRSDLQAITGPSDGESAAILLGNDQVVLSQVNSELQLVAVKLRGFDYGVVAAFPPSYLPETAPLRITAACSEVVRTSGGSAMPLNTFERLCPLCEPFAEATRWGRQAVEIRFSYLAMNSSVVMCARPTRTATVTPSRSDSHSLTITRSSSSTDSRTPSSTASPSRTPSRTLSSTASRSREATVTPTVSASLSETRRLTVTATLLPTPTVSISEYCRVSFRLVSSPDEIFMLHFRDRLDASLNIHVALLQDTITAPLNRLMLTDSERWNNFEKTEVLQGINSTWGVISNISTNPSNSSLILILRPPHDVPLDQLPIFELTIVTITLPITETPLFSCKNVLPPSSDAERRAATVISVRFTPADAPIPRATRRSLEFAAMVSTSVSGAITTPTTGMMQARASALLSISLCHFSHTEHLEPTDSPLGWSVGAPAGGYYRGALVGAAVIVLFCIVFGAIVTWLFFDPRRTDRRLWGAMGVVHLPGALIIPLSLLLQGSTMAATALLGHGNGGSDIGLAIGTFVTVLAIVGAVIHRTTSGFYAVVGAREEALDPCKNIVQRALYHMFLSRQKWINDPAIPAKSSGFKMHWQHVFSSFKGGRQWFLGVELAISVVVGILNGVKREDSCSMVAAAFLLLIALQFFLAVFLRPFIAPFETYFHLKLSTMTFASAMLSVLGEWRGSEGAQKVAAYIAMTAVGFSTFKSLLDAASLLRWFRSQYSHRQRKRAKRLQARKLLRSTSRSSGGSGSELLSAPLRDAWLQPTEYSDEDIEDCTDRDEADAMEGFFRFVDGAIACWRRYCVCYARPRGFSERADGNEPLADADASCSDTVEMAETQRAELQPVEMARCTMTLGGAVPAVDRATTTALHPGASSTSPTPITAADGESPSHSPRRSKEKVSPQRVASAAKLRGALTSLAVHNSAMEAELADVEHELTQAQADAIGCPGSTAVQLHSSKSFAQQERLASIVLAICSQQLRRNRHAHAYHHQQIDP